MGDNLEADLLEILKPSVRADVRGVAVHQVLGLTGSQDGCVFIAHHPKLLECLLQLLTDKSPEMRKEAVKIMINLTAEETTALALLQPSLESPFTHVVSVLLEQCLDLDSDDTSTCPILTNLTRSTDCARFVARALTESESLGLVLFVKRLGELYGRKSGKFSAVSTLLMNLTQVPSVRRGLMEAPDRLLLRLLPMIPASSELSTSLSQCRTVVGTVLNCCFEYDFHSWLLSEEVDLLPRLLLPLAGPEEFDEDDMEKLPTELQYLEPSKTREADPEIRNMLVKAIHKLCGTKAGRRYVKDKNAYVMLRELHKWEKDEKNVDDIMDVIDVLIADEPEPGLEELQDVNIPEHLEKKFEEN